MPKEVNYAPGAKLPAFSCSLPPHGYEYHANAAMTYLDFTTVRRAVLTGTLTPEQFQTAQLEDPFCSQVISKIKIFEKYAIIQGLLYFRTHKTMKLVLSSALLDVVIHAKHFQSLVFISPKLK